VYGYNNGSIGVSGYSQRWIGVLGHSDSSTEVDKIKPRSELFMLLNLLEGNEIHKVVNKVEYHIKLKIRVFCYLPRCL
jgi:hypothetical protein